MKKILVVLVVLSIVVMAGIGYADVANSRHNLVTGWVAGGITSPNATAGQGATVCGFCHIPHGGDVSIAGVPLWARKLTDIAAAGNYDIYGAGLTLANTTVNDPGANSLTCLSCHDGSIGLGVTFKNGISRTFTMQSVPANLLGAGGVLNYAGYAAAYTTGSTAGYNPAIGGVTTTDLTNDHPVGLEYIETVAGLDTKLAITALGLKLYNIGAIDRVECGSCHDPHDTTHGAFLRRAPATICQDCHVSK